MAHVYEVSPVDSELDGVWYTTSKAEAIQAARIVAKSGQEATVNRCRIAPSTSAEHFARLLNRVGWCQSNVHVITIPGNRTP